MEVLCITFLLPSPPILTSSFSSHRPRILSFQSSCPCVPLRTAPLQRSVNNVHQSSNLYERESGLVAPCCSLWNSSILVLKPLTFLERCSGRACRSEPLDTLLQSSQSLGDEVLSLEFIVRRAPAAGRHIGKPRSVLAPMSSTVSSTVGSAGVWLGLKCARTCCCLFWRSSSTLICVSTAFWRLSSESVYPP